MNTHFTSVLFFVVLVAIGTVFVLTGTAALAINENQALQREKPTPPLASAPSTSQAAAPAIVKTLPTQAVPSLVVSTDATAPTVTPSPEACALKPSEWETLQALLAASIPPALEKRSSQAYLATFVSSGIFDIVTIPLADGSSINLHRILAHTTGKDGNIITIPVSIGAVMPTGYLSYTNPARSQPWADLAEAQTYALPRGRLFTALLVADFVQSHSVDWKKCEQTDWVLEHFGPHICQLGTYVEQQFPGALNTFLDGQQPPEGWFLAGWTIDAESVPIKFLEGMPACGTEE